MKSTHALTHAQLHDTHLPKNVFLEARTLDLWYLVAARQILGLDKPLHRPILPPLTLSSFWILLEKSNGQLVIFPIAKKI